jgi:hypothetical protein
MVLIYGKKYKKDSIMLEFSKGVGLDTSMFYFEEETQVFKLREYIMSIEPEVYLNLKK